MELNRYDRQQRITGWDQSKVNNGKIALIGSGPLAQMTLAALLGMGVGTIRIYDNSYVGKDTSGEFLMWDAKPGERRVDALESIAHEINPLINVEGIHFTFEEYSWLKVLDYPNVIVDCTNDAAIEQLLFVYGQENNIPICNISTGQWKGEIATLLPGNQIPAHYLSPDFYGLEQGIGTSIVMAGLAAEEVRKILTPYDEKDTILADELHYNRLSSMRFEDKEDTPLYEFPRDKVAVVYGAGSLGNIVAWGLACKNVGYLLIVDDDTVEEVNLNRQLLFYDAVGQPKAKALARKIQQIGPSTKVDFRIEQFTPNFNFRKVKPDVIFACTDSFESRAMLNKYCGEHSIPLISGGTDYKSGEVVTFQPGETSCLECLLDVSNRAEKARPPAGCIHAPDPSVIISNMVVGGLMVGEMGALFAESPSFNGTLNYYALEQRRLVAIAAVDTCKHFGSDKK